MVIIAWQKILDPLLAGLVQLQAQREARAPGLPHPRLPRQILLPKDGHHEQAGVRRHPDLRTHQTHPRLRLLQAPDAPDCPGPHRLCSSRREASAVCAHA